MRTRGRLRLIHWNTAEAAQRAAALARLGWETEHELPPAPQLLRALRAAPPRAVVIDLGRLPSQGRDVGVNLRLLAATRHVPLVFIAGDPRKTEAIRSILPDAVYTSWDQIGPVLDRATRAPLQDPVVPSSVFAGYSGTPLVKKLGIKEGTTVATVGAPADFARLLGDLPKGARLSKGTAAKPELVIWFVRTQGDLESRVGRMAALTVEGRLWIAWRKKATGGAGGPTERTAPVAGPTERSVRAAGLGAGMVDYKVCAIDQTWSGLLFRRARSG